MSFKKIIIIVGVVLFIVWILTPWIIAFFSGVRWDSAGNFGDTYGFFNALVSMMALLGVLYNLYNQQEEIKAQRLAQDASEKALQRQTDVLAKQLETLSNSFFYQQKKELAEFAPFFKEESGTQTLIGFETRLRNLGKQISDVKFFSEDVDIVTRDSSLNLIEKDKTFYICYSFKKPMPKYEFKFTIEYTNLLGIRVSQLIHYSERSYKHEPPVLLQPA